MTKIVADPIYRKHLTGPFHPESVDRYDAIYESLKSLPVEFINPRMADIDDILLCHTQKYINSVKKDIFEAKSLGIVDGSYTLSTGDTQICPDSYIAAIAAAGGVLEAIDIVFEKKDKNAFCLIRPPGHHACSNQGMGFCIFNNIAIGARYAQKKYGIKKVLIVDWDVHHGNGTQEIFDSDPSVFYFSTHEWPLYPGTGSVNDVGKGKAAGTKLNCPIQAGENSRKEIIEAFEKKLIPAMDTFNPELVLISCGFDAHHLDPLGGLNLTDDDYATLTDIVLTIAKKYAKGRLVSVLEGGYDLRALASAARAHVERLKFVN